MSKGKTRFWKVYGIVTASAVLVLAAFLAVFYDYIHTYERSQPEHAAEQYAASVSQADVCAWIREEAAGLSSAYETNEQITDAYLAAFRAMDTDFSCERDYAAPAQTPAYRILSGEIPVATLTLEKSGTMRYGFPQWRVSKVHAFLDGWDVGKIRRVVYAPQEGIVSVNGIELSPDTAEEVTEMQFSGNPFEAAETLCMRSYTITGLYEEPLVTCEMAGKSCSAETEDEIIRFLVPDSVFQTYTVAAPTGSEITINGIVLDSSYQSDEQLSYTYQSVEADADDLPSICAYIIPRFLQTPEVKGTLHGVPLVFHLDNTCFTAGYPEELTYSCRISVPAGSEVRIRGVSCAEYKSEEKVDAYPELFDDAADAPKYEVYEIHSLFLPCGAVSVLYQGKELETSATEQGRVISITAQYPEASVHDVQERALSFARDYFLYVSNGYQNTDANLERALAHIVRGSDLYTRIQRSKESISFVTPVSAQEYRTLEISEMRALNDTRIVCTLDFDIDQRIYYVSRSYTGTLRLVCEKINGSWLVSRMQIENK